MIIDGKSIANKILGGLSEKITSLTVRPCIAVVLVGEHGPSTTYVRQKQLAAERVGMDFRLCAFDPHITESTLLSEIEKLNTDDSVSGFLVQLPLPPHIDKDRIIAAIDPDKDVDGFTPTNIWELFLGHDRLTSCTPKWIVRLLREYNIEISGKNIVIIGKSNIVGKPLALLFMNLGGTVTVCHKETRDLTQFTKHADIVVVAAGRPWLLTMDMLRPWAVIIDVGTTIVDGKLVGDADFAAIEPHCAITPVPGGVGPMTVAMLMENTYLAALRSKG